MAEYGGVYPGWNGPSFAESISDLDSYLEASYASLNDLRYQAYLMPAGKLIGGVVRFQVPDGYAWYIITREKPLTLCWIPCAYELKATMADIHCFDQKDAVAAVTRERLMVRLSEKRQEKENG